jgi:hypothetical protein
MYNKITSVTFRKFMEKVTTSVDVSISKYYSFQL